ncbi:MAG TPA: AI-2E family transporter [Nitrospirales bacterium]|nr:AI-2E family transporter [Nitrospirales bacterium]
MTRRDWLNVTFVLVFLGLLAGLALVFTPFLEPIIWAMILARVSAPIHQRILRWLPRHETAAALVMTLGMLLIAVVPAAFVIGMSADEGVRAYERASEWIRQGRLKQAGEWLSTLPFLGTFGQELAGRFIVEQGNVEGWLLAGGKSLGTYLAVQGTESVKNVLLLLVDFAVMLFTMFFVFRDGDRLYARIYRLVPLEEAHKSRITSRLSKAITAVVRGTLLTAIAQGAVAGTTYWLLGVPFPVFLGTLSGFLSLLPMGGTGFVWGPVTIYLAAQGAYGKAGIMLLVGALLVGLMDNLLYPYLVGTRMRLPMILLFFASLGGMAAFGFIGLFIGPILLAITMAAFDIYEEDFRPDRGMIVTTQEEQGLKRAQADGEPVMTMQEARRTP